MTFLKFEILVVLFVLATYLLGIILVYVNVRLPARYNFQVLSTEEMAQITPPAFRNFVNTIHSLGFDLVAHLRSVNGSTGNTTTLTLLYNRAALDLALVCEIKIAQMSATVKSLCYAEFVTVFEDGREVCTNNSTAGSSFVPNPQKPIYKLPEVNDLESLYAIHTGLASNVNAARKSLPPQDQEIISLEEDIVRPMERQASMGYLRLDESSQMYRPTVKGAVIMTAQSLWPLSMIRKQRAAAQSRRIRKDFQPANVQTSSSFKPQRSS